MEILFIAIIIGLIPAFIANSKGNDFVLWWVYGAFLFPFAMIHSIVIKPNNTAISNDNTMKKCPFCAEFIKNEAIVCRYCGKDLPRPGSFGIEGVDRDMHETFEGKLIGNGIYLIDVESPAKDAGLQKGDTLIAIDNHLIDTAKDLKNVAQEKNAGDVVKVTYLRDNAEHTTQVRLA